MSENRETYTAHKRKSDKQEQTIEQHLWGTAAKAMSFASKIDLPITGCILGLLHDIGKYSEDFQKRINENGEKCDHSTAAAIFLNSFYQSETDDFVKTMLKAMMLASLGHHGGLMDVFSAEKDNLTERLSKLRLLNQVKGRARCILEEAGLLLSSPKFNSEAKNAIQSIVNNIKTYTNKDSDIIYFELSLLVKFLHSCLIDADRLDTIKFEYGEEIIPKENWDEIERALDKKIASFPKNHLSEIRNEIYSLCAEKGSEKSKLNSLKVQTGGGKTLSSFKFALKNAAAGKHRIIYVLPFISIIEQNAEVIRKVLSENNLNPDILEESHSSVVTDDDYTDYDFVEEEKAKTYRLQSNWERQIVFTTMVGFLESVFGDGTQRIRRFHNLSHSVIIFDEIQSLPLKCTCMFNLLVRFLTEECNSTIVLCSATQPLLHKIGDSFENDSSHSYKKFQLKAPEQIVDKFYPLLERTELIFDKHGCTYEQISEKIISSLDEVNNILVVVNTKKSANVLYSLLEKRKLKLYYLSTNLCPQHRADVIYAIKKSIADKEKFVCVSTQLIESGVDVDFERAFRFLAGIDSIIQTAGRCNREGNLKDDKGIPIKGKVFIVDCREESLANLEEIRKNKALTLSTFYDKNYIDDSSANNYYIRKYYSEAAVSQTLKFPVSLRFIDTTLVDLLSSNMKVAQNRQTELSQSFKSAAENLKDWRFRTPTFRLLRNWPPRVCCWEKEQSGISMRIAGAVKTR